MDQSTGVNVRRVKILDYICCRSVPRGTGVNEITRNKTVSHVGVILGASGWKDRNKKGLGGI